MTQSYFENIDLYIITTLMSAQNSIRAAVAWCTDPQILRVLTTALQRGVEVELIVNDDKTNRKADYSTITSNGGKIFYADKDSNIMHNKFCIIDHCRVVCGSYNWTSHAKGNDEQITLIDDDADEVNAYERKYDELLLAIEYKARALAEKVENSRTKQKNSTTDISDIGLNIPKKELRIPVSLSLDSVLYDRLTLASLKLDVSRSSIIEQLFNHWWKEYGESIKAMKYKYENEIQKQ